MSEALEAIAAPVVDTFPPGTDRVTLERAYSVAMAVWNATHPIAPPGQLDEIVRFLGGDEASQAVVALMVARRRELYPDDTRVVAGVEVRMEGSRPRIIVASVVPKPQAK